jgi:hypothetical protein
MRQGVNPNALELKELGHVLHRVIIPVYIPTMDGFYTESFNTFKACLDSLISSIGEETKITIIDNNSIEEVKDYCSALLEKGLLDRFVQNHENRGKVETVLGEARASFEPLITISDCDILFRNNWLIDVIDAFKKIRGLGTLGLLSFPDLSFRNTSAVLFSRFWKLRFKKALSDEQIYETYKSVGQVDPEKLSALRTLKQLVFRQGKMEYLVGNNHAVATYRREVFFELTDRKVKYVFSSKGYKADQIFLDEAVDYQGWLRLSFKEARAYHMGNTWDEEYNKKLDILKRPEKSEAKIYDETKLQSGPVSILLPWSVRTWMISILDRIYRYMYLKN